VGEWRVNRLFGNLHGTRHQGTLRILCTRPGTFWLRKKRRISWAACRPLASQEVCSLDLAYFYVFISYFIFLYFLCIWWIIMESDIISVFHLFWFFRWQFLRLRIGYKFEDYVWGLMSCMLIEMRRNFERTFCLHLQGWRRKQQVFIFANLTKAIFLNTLQDGSGKLISDPLVLAS